MMTTKTDPTTNRTKQPTSRKDSVATVGTSVAPAAEGASPPRPTVAPATSTTPNQQSKSATVLKLLSRAKGATIAEISEPTSWQPHSTRAYLSGLRKKGLTVIREQRRTGETTYRIVDAGSVKVDASVGRAADTSCPAASTGTEAAGTAANKTDDASPFTDARPDAGLPAASA